MIGRPYVDGAQVRTCMIHDTFYFIVVICMIYHISLCYAVCGLLSEFLRDFEGSADSVVIVTAISVIG